MPNAMTPITAARIAFDPANMNRRSRRSTKAPIGIANKSQGNITIAPSAEIRTVLSVRAIARSGAAAPKTPSARFETMLAAHMRLKAGPISKTLSDGVKSKEVFEPFQRRYGDHQHRVCDTHCADVSSLCSEKYGVAWRWR